MAEAVDVLRRRRRAVAGAGDAARPAPGRSLGRSGRVAGEVAARRAVPARGRQRRRSRGPGDRAARPPAGRTVPARRARRAGRARRTRRRPGHRRQRRQLGGPCRAQPRPRSRGRTSSTCTSAKASAAPSSPTARSAAVTPAWPARSPTWSRSAREGWRCGSPTSSTRSAFAVPVSTAIDVPALLRAVEPDTEAAAELRNTLARAVAGVLSAVVALTDPAVVLVGGPWGRHPSVLAAVAREFADAPRARAGRSRRRQRRAGAGRGA